MSDDYAQPTPMELTIVAGADQQCTSISISDDPILENDELFSVELNTSDQAVTLHPSSANITIEDDDGTVGILRLARMHLVYVDE